MKKHKFMACGKDELCTCGATCAVFGCSRGKEDPIHHVDKGRNPLHPEYCTCVDCEYSQLPAERRPPEGHKDTNPKDAIGVTKPPVSTVPFPVIAELGLAWLEGACKYGRHNGRVIGVRASVYIDAMFRHVFAWWECGQDTDPDSGLPHLMKAAACLGMLRDGEIRGNLVDDRPPKTDEAYLVWLQAKTKEILAKYPNPVKPYTEKNKSEKR